MQLRRKFFVVSIGFAVDVKNEKLCKSVIILLLRKHVIKENIP